MNHGAQTMVWVYSFITSSSVWEICNEFSTQRVEMVQFIRKHVLLETVKDRTVITETSLATLMPATLAGPGAVTTSLYLLRYASEKSGRCSSPTDFIFVLYLWHRKPIFLCITILPWLRDVSPNFPTCTTSVNTSHWAVTTNPQTCTVPRMGHSYWPHL